MPRNIIVLRRSPDWLNFDMEETRAFCRAIGIAESAVIDFAARWDQQTNLGYLAFRAAVKDIALDMMRACRNAIIVDYRDLAAMVVDDDDIFYFSDDDDWVAPNLFPVLREHPVVDGFLWGSVYVGRLFVDTPQENFASPVISKRDFGKVVYTNNYAVSGRALRSLGLPRVQEHFHAQQALDSGDFEPSPVHAHLSAAAKHFCCTVSIQYNSASASFMDDLRGAAATFAMELDRADLSGGLEWLRDPVSRLAALNRKAAG